VIRRLSVASPCAGLPLVSSLGLLLAQQARAIFSEIRAMACDKEGHPSSATRKGGYTSAAPYNQQHDPLSKPSFSNIQSREKGRQNAH
jgi:hypothetical protein